MLYCFDIDGTLIRSFMREGGTVADYDLVEVLPERQRLITELLAEEKRGVCRNTAVLVTNQGGVALGYQTKRQVAQKIARVLAEVGIPAGPIRTRPNAAIDETGLAVPPYREPWMPSAYVSFGLPHATDPAYQVLSSDDWRKPGPGMLVAAMRDWKTPRREVVYVGDMDSDRWAAAAADVSYVDAAAFFA